VGFEVEDFVLRRVRLCGLRCRVWGPGSGLGLGPTGRDDGMIRNQKCGAGFGTLPGPAEYTLRVYCPDDERCPHTNTQTHKHTDTERCPHTNIQTYRHRKVRLQV
jgi:hypothetical protein